MGVLPSRAPLPALARVGRAKWSLDELPAASLPSGAHNTSAAGLLPRLVRLAGRDTKTAPRWPACTVAADITVIGLFAACAAVGEPGCCMLLSVDAVPATLPKACASLYSPGVRDADGTWLGGWVVAPLAAPCGAPAGASCAAADGRSPGPAAAAPAATARGSAALPAAAAS